LSAELADEKLVTLNASGEEFLALWKHDTSGNPFGAVILLHDQGHTIGWPQDIKGLRDELAQYGWSTLAVALPNPKDQEIKARPSLAPTPAPENAEGEDNGEKTAQDAAENTPEESKAKQSTEKDNTASTANTSPPPPKKIAAPKLTAAEIEAMAIARLEASMKHLNSIGQFNIAIMGSGVGAARAVNFIHKLTNSNGSKDAKQNVAAVGAKAIIERPLRALIMVNARNSVTGMDKQLPKLLIDPGLPVLDLVFNDHHLDQVEAKARKDKASRLQMENYYQVKLLRPAKSKKDYLNHTVRRTRGFLNRHAKGVEIK